MTTLFRIRLASLLGLCALAAATTGCEQPEVTEMGSPLSAGGVEFDVTDHELRILELNDGDEIIEYSEPVLAIEVELTNRDGEELTYSPTHRSQQMSEANTPLLYRDPGGDAELPPSTKQTIDAVYLDEGRLDEQVSDTRTLAEGESLTDVFLFEVPDEKQADLILSLPPAMHRGEAPVLFRFSYQYEEPEGPALHQVGDQVDRDDVQFTVEEVATEYVKIEESSSGEGYSDEPLFVVTYKIENNGGETISYEPAHRDVAGSRGAALYADGETIKRVRFSAGTTPAGQTEGDTDIEAGDSVTDIALFERPPEETEALTFEYPARRFDRSGLIRVEISYEYDDPDEPEELKEAKKDG